LHDYSISDFTFWSEEFQKQYLEEKEINSKIFEENVDLYINGKNII